MKYFLDTEFIEYLDSLSNPRTDLISVGIVREDGEKFYKVLSDVDLDEIYNNDWVKDNVYIPAMKALFPDKTGDDLVEAIYEYNYTKEDLKKDLFEFFNSDPNEVKDRQIYAFYGAYDLALLCEVTSFMNAPFNPVLHEIQVLIDALPDNIKDGMPEQDSDAHLAINDAEYNRIMYNYITAYHAK